MIDRSSLLGLLRSSALARRFDFARAAALDWLAVWPGDAEVQHLLAQAEIELGHDDLAIDRLLRLVSVDPEDTQAYLSLAENLRRRGDAAQARVVRRVRPRAAQRRSRPQRHPRLGGSPDARNPRLVPGRYRRGASAGCAGAVSRSRQPLADAGRTQGASRPRRPPGGVRLWLLPRTSAGRSAWRCAWCTPRR